MRLQAILTVWRKELLEAVRDRRTLISTLVIPTVVMPLIFMAAGAISMRMVGKAKAEVSEIMILGAKESPRLVEALRGSAKLHCGDASADWRAKVGDKKVRAVIAIPEGFDRSLESGAPLEVRIYDYEGELRSGLAVGELRRILNEYRDRMIRERLQARGLAPSLVEPFSVKTENVAPPEKVGGNLLGGIIPYMFIIFSLSGAMYPAIDLTAGEKERGTMETILCTPVGRTELVLGKFLTVFTASLVTVVASVTSMGLSLTLGGTLLAAKSKGAAAALGGAGSGVVPIIDPAGLLGVIGLALPVAAMFAALLLAISLAARNTKEAQSYAMPLMVVVILPAMMGMLPGMELSARAALVPVMNLALASKELLSGVWHWKLLAVIFGSSCLYAALALRFCVRQFNREDVIFKT